MMVTMEMTIMGMVTMTTITDIPVTMIVTMEAMTVIMDMV